MTKKEMGWLSIGWFFVAVLMALQGRIELMADALIVSTIWSVASQFKK